MLKTTVECKFGWDQKKKNSKILPKGTFLIPVTNESNLTNYNAILCKIKDTETYIWIFKGEYEEIPDPEPNVSKGYRG